MDYKAIPVVTVRTGAVAAGKVVAAAIRQHGPAKLGIDGYTIARAHQPGGGILALSATMADGSERVACTLVALVGPGGRQSPDVRSAHGAPMGRGEQPTHDDGDMQDLTRQPLQLFRVRMIDGGYDDGGAYWGGASSEHGHLYCVRADGVELFQRAHTRDAAKAAIRARFPDYAIRFKA